MRLSEWTTWSNWIVIVTECICITTEWVHIFVILCIIYRKYLNHSTVYEIYRHSPICQYGTLHLNVALARSRTDSSCTNKRGMIWPGYTKSNSVIAPRRRRLLKPHGSPSNKFFVDSMSRSAGSKLYAPCYTLSRYHHHHGVTTSPSSFRDEGLPIVGSASHARVNMYYSLYHI
jgi:hypothetical protein